MLNETYIWEILIFIIILCTFSHLFAWNGETIVILQPKANPAAHKFENIHKLRLIPKDV